MTANRDAFNARRAEHLIGVIERVRAELTGYSYASVMPQAALDEWSYACRELARMNGGKPCLKGLVWGEQHSVAWPAGV